MKPSPSCRQLLRASFLIGTTVAALTVVFVETGTVTAAQTLYVSTHGNDHWSGALPVPNPERTDGPLASIAEARDRIRQRKSQAGLRQPVCVQIRGGTYHLPQTLTFTADDSGSKECPISYEAFPGERPVLCGGKKITGWQPDRGEILSVVLPGAAAGKWYFRSLFADGRRQVRARYPNIDPADPCRQGFLYVDRDAEGFGLAVNNIHNPGDWMEYKVPIPADGEYAFWIYYGAFNKPFGRGDMDGRTVILVDSGEPVPLMNLPDTAGWDDYRWSRAATVRLTAGEHVLKWQNVKGGGLGLEAFALTDDFAWKPASASLPAIANEKHLIVVQAENFVKYQGKQLSVSGTSAGSRTEFCYSPGTLKPAWAESPGAEIHIFPSSSGSCRAFKLIVSLKSIDEKTRTATIGGDECVAAVLPGDRYFVENSLDLLDHPGEWYLDRKTGRLSWWPQGELSEKTEVVAPVLGRLVEFLGDAAKAKPVSGIRLAGLVFQETDYSPGDGCVGYGMGNDGVVYMKDATDCRIENCTFRNIGKYAICATGGHGHVFRSNDLSDSAEGGILLLDSAANQVVDNLIHHCGAVYKHIGGVVLQGAGTDENLVAHNLIHDISRYGISLKNPGKRNVIEYNRVHHTNLETYDTGGIEVTQHDREFRSGSVIRYNVVGDTIGYSSIGPRPLFMSWSIYLDSFAGGYTVTHNIAYRSSHGGIMLQGGKDNTVENNIFVDGTDRQMCFNNFSGNSTGQVFRENIVSFSAPEAMLLTGGKLSRDVIVADRNLYFHAGGRDLVIRAGGLSSFAEWQKQGFDQNSLVADPRFVDAAADHYALRPDSPAFTLGFEPIDASRIGLLSER